MKHFRCLKFVSCPQFGLLSASIVSRILYTMDICLPASMVKEGPTKKKTTKNVFPTTLVSGLVAKSLVCLFFVIFGFGLIRINPN